MYRLVRLRWYTITLWKCAGILHATLATHRGKDQSFQQAQAAHYEEQCSCSGISHASANMLNILTTKRR